MSQIPLEHSEPDVIPVSRPQTSLMWALVGVLAVVFAPAFVLALLNVLVGH